VGLLRCPPIIFRVIFFDRFCVGDNSRELPSSHTLSVNFHILSKIKTQINQNRKLARQSCFSTLKCPRTPQTIQRPPSARISSFAEKYRKARNVIQIPGRRIPYGLSCHPISTGHGWKINA
jgi:hypothetical protein